MAKQKPHRIAVMAFDGVVPFDLATPLEVFGRTPVPTGRRPYEVLICSLKRKVSTIAFDMYVRGGLQELVAADTVIVPGICDIDAPVPEPLLAALRDAADSGARIASICTGAFILAASGLLEGLNATTHWMAASILASRYPGIFVNPNVLFVDNGSILTSAGASAGLDLCLHLIRRDHGAAVAAHAAKMSVVPLERSGGQSQFIAYSRPISTSSLGSLLTWIEERLDQPLSLEMLSVKAGLSIRTLARRFQEQVGSSPHKWIVQARVRRAQTLLETTKLSVERVAMESGFGSSVSLREHFRHIVGTSPQSYRNAFPSVNESEN